MVWQSPLGTHFVWFLSVYCFIDMVVHGTGKIVVLDSTRPYSSAITEEEYGLGSDGRYIIKYSGHFR